MRVHTVTTPRDVKLTIREHHGLFLQSPPPNPTISPPPLNRASYCSSGIVIPPPSPFSTQTMRVPTTPAHIFFLRKKIPATHRARGETPTTSLALGADREGKDLVKRKSSRIQSSRIGSSLVCVRRNAQHRELKLLKFTRFALITAIMAAVPTGGPTGCLVIILPSCPRSNQTVTRIITRELNTSHRVRGETQTTSLALGANREGKEKVKGE